MGQQIETRARLGGAIRRGTAMLETDYILFRGAGKKESATRVKIQFGDVLSLHAKDGWLRIHSRSGSLELELGARAEKWAEKIRSPKSRLDKLGAAPGASVTLAGAGDADFRRELSSRGCEILEGAPARGSALVFYGAEARGDLARVKSLAGRIAPDGALWVVYPKGQKHITENDVLAAGRAAGLKDVKVVGFSPTHTALKFVIPLAARKQR
jgi:hypothetical protein